MDILNVYALLVSYFHMDIRYVYVICNLVGTLRSWTHLPNILPDLRNTMIYINDFFVFLCKFCNIVFKQVTFANIFLNVWTFF